MLKLADKQLLATSVGVKAMGKWNGPPHEPQYLCHAKSKQTGKRCRQFAAYGKRSCYYHGARSNGASNPVTKHGRYTKESIALRKQIAELTRLTNETMKKMNL
jgi:hypothetical protein